MEHIGRFLREVRQQAELTQTDLADRLGVLQTSVSKVEQRRDVRMSTLDRHVRAAGAEFRIVVSFTDQGN
jgi:transcriptional regulator with XRE-family HTH domain